MQGGDSFFLLRAANTVWSAVRHNWIVGITTRDNLAGLRVDGKNLLRGILSSGTDPTVDLTRWSQIEISIALNIK